MESYSSQRVGVVGSGRGSEVDAVGSGDCGVSGGGGEGDGGRVGVCAGSIQAQGSMSYQSSELDAEGGPASQTTS